MVLIFFFFFHRVARQKQEKVEICTGHAITQAHMPTRSHTQTHAHTQTCRIVSQLFYHYPKSHLLVLRFTTAAHAGKTSLSSLSPRVTLLISFSLRLSLRLSLALCHPTSHSPPLFHSPSRSGWLSGLPLPHIPTPLALLLPQRSTARTRGVAPLCGVGPRLPPSLPPPIRSENNRRGPGRAAAHNNRDPPLALRRPGAPSPWRRRTFFPTGSRIVPASPHARGGPRSSATGGGHFKGRPAHSCSLSLRQPAPVCNHY